MNRRPFTLMASAALPALMLLASAGAARAEVGEHTIKFASQNPKGHKAQIAADGVEITKPSPEDVTKLRELAKPVVDKQKAAANPDMVKLLETELAKAQGKS